MRTWWCQSSFIRVVKPSSDSPFPYNAELVLPKDLYSVFKLGDAVYTLGLSELWFLYEDPRGEQISEEEQKSAARIMGVKDFSDLRKLIVVKSELLHQYLRDNKLSCAPCPSFVEKNESSEAVVKTLMSDSGIIFGCSGIFRNL